MTGISGAKGREAAAARIGHGRLFHAYIVSGSDFDGRKAAADHIAMAAVCSGRGEKPCQNCRDCRKAKEGVHPDITYVLPEKEGKEITVDAARMMRSWAAVMPNEAEKSVYIVPEADNMNEKAQNAVLKVVEEPPSHAVFIFMAENPQKLLQTIRSRCEELRLLPVEEGADADAREILDICEKGDSAALLRKSVQLGKMDRSELRDLMEGLRRAVAERAGSGDSSLSGDRLIEIAKCAEKACKYLDANVNPSSVSGMLLAELLNE